jgi:hypothetical protein
LAADLEDLRVALPQHLRHHVIGDATRTEPGREGVPKFVERELTYTRLLQCVRPNFAQVGDMGLLPGRDGTGEQIFGARLVLDLTPECLARRAG